MKNVSTKNAKNVAPTNYFKTLLMEHTDLILFLFLVICYVLCFVYVQPHENLNFKKSKKINQTTKIINQF